MNKNYMKFFISCGLLSITGLCYCISMNGCGRESKVISSLSQSGQSTMEEVKPISDTPSVTSFPLVTYTPENTKNLYAHICGAVVNPGVYKLKADARVCDLIKQSGGLKKEAAGDYINQAEAVKDGQRIYIPKKEELKDLPATQILAGVSLNNKEDVNSELININTAAQEELMSLPGIGQAKADSIIRYRTEHGNFKSIDELLVIEGIKEGVFSRISPYITTK